MDELRLLARALPDAPPPSAEVVEKARLRLAAAQRKPVRPGRANRRGLAWGWTLGAAATTIAVVMAVVTLVSNVTAVPAPVLAPAGGNGALLRLADQIAKLPDERGDYWRRPLLNNELIRVRAGGETFNVLSSSRIDLWQPRDPGDPVQAEQRQLFVRPATEADERAWRAAGSPVTVQRPVCTGVGDCAKVRLRSKPSQCVYTRAAEPGGVLGDARLGELTLADLAALPGDAEQLRRNCEPTGRPERTASPRSASKNSSPPPPTFWSSRSSPRSGQPPCVSSPDCRRPRCVARSPTLWDVRESRSPSKRERVSSSSVPMTRWHSGTPPSSTRGPAPSWRLTSRSRSRARRGSPRGRSWTIRHGHLRRAGPANAPSGHAAAGSATVRSRDEPPRARTLTTFLSVSACGRRDRVLLVSAGDMRPNNVADSRSSCVAGHTMDRTSTGRMGDSPQGIARGGVRSVRRTGEERHPGVVEPGRLHWWRIPASNTGGATYKAVLDAIADYEGR